MQSIDWQELLSWIKQQDAVIKVSLEQGMPEDAAVLSQKVLSKLTNAMDVAFREGHGEQWDELERHFQTKLKQAQKIIAESEADASTIDMESEMDEQAELSADDYQTKGEGLYHVGLYNEALESLIIAYEKGLKNYDTITQILETWGKLGKYQEQAEFLLTALKQAPLQKRDKAKLCFHLGNVYTRLNNPVRAKQAFLKSKELDPENPLVGSKLKALETERPTYDNPYSFLIEDGKLNPKDLEAAQTRAREQGLNLNQVLMDDYKIAKEDLGASLSAYYDVPFVVFDPSHKPSADLFESKKVESEFLKKNGWYPLAHKDNAIEVLMTDPFNLPRLDEIRFIFDTSRVEPKVALQQDIESYIDLAFKGPKQAAEPPKPKTKACVLNVFVEVKGLDENGMEVSPALFGERMRFNFKTREEALDTANEMLNVINVTGRK